MDDFPKEMPCPCGSTQTYRLTRTRRDGGLSHEFRCRRNGRGCNRRSTYRWEDGKLCKAKSCTRPKLTRDQARAIVRSELSAYRLADKLGISPSTVKDIRTGRIHASDTADLRGDPPKRKQDFCHQCIHFSSGCTLGFPEARSPAYAAVCTCFQEDQGEWTPTPDAFLYLEHQQETPAIA